jgi:hypothetical protein
MLNGQEYITKWSQYIQKREESIIYAQKLSQLIQEN